MSDINLRNIDSLINKNIAIYRCLGEQSSFTLPNHLLNVHFRNALIKKYNLNY